MKLCAVLLFIFIVCLSNSKSQTTLIEDFDYPAFDSLGAHGWVSFSGGVTNILRVTSPGLTFPGYAGSGVGNATTVYTSGQDAFTSLSSADSSGSFYVTAMVRVTSAQAGDYFMAFLPDTSTRFYSGRLHARINYGNVNFGITKNAPSDTLMPTIWTTANYSLNTTYLIVMKYTFVEGGNTNDQVSLFVFTSSLPSSEPVPTVGPLTYTSTDAPNLGRIALRQGTATRAPILIADGIRVSRYWPTINLNLRISFEGLYVTSTDKMARIDTAKVFLYQSFPPYDTVDSAIAYVDSISFTGSFTFHNTQTGMYYIGVNHMNSIETWSATPRPFPLGGTVFYDFTTSAYKAYGNNMKLKGSMYCIFSGDVNQDGCVDASDVSMIDNDATNFVSGYVVTDLTGDGFVDGTDFAIADNNAANFVCTIRP